MAIDLVCKMEVNENNGYSLEFESAKYLFCSQGCREEFTRRPQDYLKAQADCCKSPTKEGATRCVDS